MPNDGDLGEAVRLAALAALMGAVGRVLMAARTGPYPVTWRVLAFDATMGAFLGVVAAGAASWFGAHPLTIGAAGGLCGAVGPRAIDLLADALLRRAG